jgi:hypothetical protein
MAVKNMRGQGRDELFLLIKNLAAEVALIHTDLDALAAVYAAHRHSVAGASSTGTAPSTAAAAADATASVFTITKGTAAVTSE